MMLLWDYTEKDPSMMPFRIEGVLGRVKDVQLHLWCIEDTKPFSGTLLVWYPSCPLAVHMLPIKSLKTRAEIVTSPPPGMFGKRYGMHWIHLPPSAPYFHSEYHQDQFVSFADDPALLRSLLEAVKI
jgi:hypothetical protein